MLWLYALLPAPLLQISPEFTPVQILPHLWTKAAHHWSPVSIKCHIQWFSALTWKDLWDALDKVDHCLLFFRLFALMASSFLAPLNLTSFSLSALWSLNIGFLRAQSLDFYYSPPVFTLEVILFIPKAFNCLMLMAPNFVSPAWTAHLHFELVYSQLLEYLTNITN